MTSTILGLETIAQIIFFDAFLILLMSHRLWVRNILLHVSSLLAFSFEFRADSVQNFQGNTWIAWVSYTIGDKFAWKLALYNERYFLRLKYQVWLNSLFKPFPQYFIINSQRSRNSYVDSVGYKLTHELLIFNVSKKNIYIKMHLNLQENCLWLLRDNAEVIMESDLRIGV